MIKHAKLLADGTTETITPEQISQMRSTEPERLRRRLAGDLNAIMLTALRKEPERRYASAEAFLDDINQHRAGRPVHARRDTIRYRIAKFVHRHRIGVTSAALVIVALLGGLGVALWQANVARQEAATAEAVKEFVVRLFEQADPDAAPGEDITTRALLERSPEQIELGRYDEAERLLREALDVYRKRYGPEHGYAGISTIGALLLDQGRTKEAMPLLREAEQSWAAAFDEDDWRLLNVRQDRGACLLALRRFEEAESILLPIYPILEQKYGATDDRTVETRETLAKLYTAWGKPNQAATFQAPDSSPGG